jgi:hypothetical protein
MDDIAKAITVSAQISREAVDAVKAQVVIGARHLVANNPPEISVRAVYLDMATDDWRIVFTILNVGATPATLSNVEACDGWSPGNGQRSAHTDFRPVKALPSGTVLEPGHGIECSHLCTADSTAIHSITADHGLMKSSDYYFLVGCPYDDDNGVRRVANFDLTFDKQSKRFASTLQS